MENKTQRKNKVNQTITWPSATQYFTVNDLFALNPDIPKITLRVRLDKLMAAGQMVKVIGQKNGGKGRPSKIHAMLPVSQEVLDKAKADNVVDIDREQTPRPTSIPVDTAVNTEVSTIATNTEAAPQPTA